MRQRAPRVFFVHIQKTAGTSFRSVLDDVYGADRVYPSIDEGVARDPRAALADYTDVRRLLARPDLEDFDAFVGHLPAVAAEMLPFEVVPLTLLRDPVARAVSILDQVRRTAPFSRVHDVPIEALYDDPYLRRVMVGDFQTRMLGVGRHQVDATPPVPDPPDPPAEHGLRHPERQEDVAVVRRTIAAATLAAPEMFVPLEVDDALYRRAARRLESFEVVGVQQRFGAFVQRCAERFAWADVAVPRVNVAPAEVPIDDDLRRRIERDNPYDMRLWELATALAPG